MFVIGVCLKIFLKRLCYAKLYNDSRLYKNAYKVLTFENISCFKSIGVFERCFENGCEQATMKVPPTQKVLVFFLLLYIFLSYH